MRKTFLRKIKFIAFMIFYLVCLSKLTHAEIIAGVNLTGGLVQNPNFQNVQGTAILFGMKGDPFSWIIKSENDIVFFVNDTGTATGVLSILEFEIQKSLSDFIKVSIGVGPALPIVTAGNSWSGSGIQPVFDVGVVFNLLEVSRNAGIKVGINTQTIQTTKLFDSDQSSPPKPIQGGGGNLIIIQSNIGLEANF